MNEHLQIIAICSAIICWALVSRRLDKTLLTLPILFVGFGYLIGEAGVGLIDLRINEKLLHVFAEFTLVLVLFTDASGVNFNSLRKNAAVPARMLLIGMPLTILFGMMFVQGISPEAPWFLALLVAAILTPTDAALAQSILSSPKVPPRLREALNVESGLNDGLAVPVIILAALLSAQATGTGSHHAPENLYKFVALQLTLGPLVGIFIGYGLARLLDTSASHSFISAPGRGIAVRTDIKCDAFIRQTFCDGFGKGGTIGDPRICELEANGRVRPCRVILGEVRDPVVCIAEVKDRLRVCVGAVLQGCQASDVLRPFQRNEVILNRQHRWCVDGFTAEDTLDQLATLCQAEDLWHRPRGCVIFQPFHSARRQDQHAVRGFTAHDFLP